MCLQAYGLLGFPVPLSLKPVSVPERSLSCGPSPKFDPRFILPVGSSPSEFLHIQPPLNLFRDELSYQGSQPSSRLH